MIKRIRDFIYDINDVFVAIVILLIAVGVIFWRSTSIMAYPQYLAEKNGNTNTANLDFSDIDLTPEKIDDINPNPDDPKIDEQTQPGSDTQPGDDTPQGGDTKPEDKPDPQPQGPASQDGSVTWTNVIQKMIEVGLIKYDDRNDFMKKVNELDCGKLLKQGTFTLTNTSFEDMIKILCKIND